MDELYEVEVNLHNDESTDHIPVLLVLADTVQSKQQRKPMSALLDSGSTVTWVKRSALPKGAVPYRAPSIKSTTLAGTFESSFMVNISDVMFPEFSRSRRMNGFQARVIETNRKYDIILGRQELTKFAIDLSFSDLTIKFADVCRPMTNTEALKTVTTEDLGFELYLDLLLEEDENDDAFASDIKPSDYHEV
jgi:hypothetical protein